MEWLQILIVIVIVGVALLEGKRGFGRCLFDLAAAIITVRLARSLAFNLAPSIRVFESAQATEAALLVAFSLVLGGALLVLARYAYNATLISLDSFDNILGIGLGLAVGVLVAQVALLAMMLGAAPAKSSSLKRTVAYRECVNFETYHEVIHFLRTAGTT